MASNRGRRPGASARRGRLSGRHEPRGETSRPWRLRHALVPVLGGTPLEPALALARSLRDVREVTVLGVIPVAEDRYLSQAAAEARKLRTRLSEELAGNGARLWPKVVVSLNPHHEISAFVSDHEVDLVVLPWPEADGPPRIAGQVRALLAHCASNVLLLRAEAWQPPARVLVVLRPGEDSELALRLGLAIRATTGAEVAALRPAPQPGEAEADEESQAAGLEQVLEYLPEVEYAVLYADDPMKALVEAAAGYDLVIVGARGRGAQPGGEPDALARELVERTQAPVVVARARLEPAVHVPSEMVGFEAISILVDKWFAENTFHSSEFEDLERLRRWKEEQGVTISLALPALNEEATVANVIRTIKWALMEEVPLLDEMVLIDSNSTDRTREIAESLGIPVYIHQHLLPQYGARHGKGEALWKSLYVTSGDIILWIDTDIVNIHPRFVYGLIGPLLLRPDLKFIKGFYLRPIRVGDTIQAGGGGRVTELTARPLLNLFFPALSGLIQPLSGEYGGRREALERVPFSSGYGVETGLLIDMLETFGLEAIGQVDLIRRVHHNQPLTALSKMSFAIIQTVIRKLDQRYGLRLLKDVNRTMKLIRHEGDRFFLEVEEIAERERPPMVTLPEYRARFGRDGEAAA